MSILVRYAPVPSSTTEQYDEVVRRLGESGELPAQIISIVPSTYERVRADNRLFLLVPGHEDDNVETIVEQHDDLSVVRKRAGFPADVAEATDLRR